MSEVSFEEPAPKSPRSRFAFLLRPWFLIVVTILVILVAIPLGYRTSRLAAIPPIEVIIDRDVEERIEIDPDRNAFTFYERAWKMAPPGLDEYAYSEDADALDAGGWDAVSPAAQKSLDLCEALLDEWKRGTELKLALRTLPADVNWHTQGDLLPFETLARAAVLKSARCQHDGQLDEAWQWLRALFRYSRHFGNPGLIQDRYAGIEFHHSASLQLLAWAAHSEVTAGQLATALAELCDIYRNTVANSTCLRIEYVSNVNTLSNPELVKEMCDWTPVARDLPAQLRGTWLFVNAEPEVALILQRHLFANYLSQCDQPLWKRTSATGTSADLFLPSGTEAPPLIDPRMLDTLLTRSTIAEQFCADYYLIPESDHEQVRQLALEL
jgi:hypothetical protein